MAEGKQTFVQLQNLIDTNKFNTVQLRAEIRKVSNHQNQCKNGKPGYATYNLG